MLSLAGRESDGSILNWLSPADVARVVPMVKKHGEDKEIVARIFQVSFQYTCRAWAIPFDQRIPEFGVVIVTVVMVFETMISRLSAATRAATTPTEERTPASRRS